MCNKMPKNGNLHDFYLFTQQNVDHKFKFHSKKGQLPFIELNGQQIGDSTTIIKELSQRFEKDIDAGLTKEQKNISHAMISMVENHLTFVILSWRAKNPGEMINGYKINFQQSLGSKIPNAILSFFFRLNYGHRVRMLKLQNICFFTNFILNFRHPR